MEAFVVILVMILLFFGPSIFSSLKDWWNQNNKPNDSNNKNAINVKSNEETNKNITPIVQKSKQETQDLKNELLITLNSSLILKGLKELSVYKNKSSNELIGLIKTEQVDEKTTKIYIDDNDCPICDKFYVVIKEEHSLVTMNGLDGKPIHLDTSNPNKVISSYIDIINKELEKQTLSDIKPFTEFENPRHSTICSGFSDGVAFVKKDKKIWAINTRGEIIHGPYETCPNGYSDGWCIVKGGNGNNYAIDKNGRKVFGECPNLSDFSNGFSTFKCGRKPTGFFEYDEILKFIDKGGNILPFEFTSGNMFGIPPKFNDGIAFVKYQDGIYGFNTKGEKVLGPYTRVAEDFNDGIACVTKDKKENPDENEWFVINTEGEILSGPYNKALRFHNGLATYEDKETQQPCYINSKGETVIGPMDAVLNEFGDGYAIIEYRDLDADLKEFANTIRKGLELGLKSGSEMGNFLLNETGDSEKNSKGTYIINTKGDIVLGPYNEHVEDLGCGHFCIMNKNSRTHSLIKADGSISEKKYRLIGHYNSGFFPVKFNGQENWSLIDENENVLEIKYVEDVFSKQKIKAKTTEEAKIINKIETQEYHVVGVQFDTYKKGCYYYFGDNKVYNLGDRVLVPTSNNGNKEATVVFRKIYKNKSEIPYDGNLKTVIRKL